MRVLHITTVHPRRDTRIFYRECVSLVKNGIEVFLLVADGEGEELLHGVQILDLGKEKNRIKNFFKNNGKIRDRVKIINPDIVHYHDPELIIVAREIVNFGIPVIFDIHENIALQILDKQYIPKFIRPIVALLYRKVENLCIRNYHLVLAENSYEQYYFDKGSSCTTVLNMPNISDFEPYININRKGHEIFYIGGISDERGLDITLKALKILNKKDVEFYMHYIGPISEEKLNQLDLSEISDKIKFYGRMDSKEGFAISQRCIVGLSVLKPIKNYILSYSTKIFEYMAIGMPVITSNFPLYKKVVEKYDCGFCIDPYSPNDLADAIEFLFCNPISAQEMGSKGRQIILEKFSWSTEEEKLLNMYSSINNFQKKRI